MNRRLYIDNILGLPLNSEYLVDFSNGAKSIINIPIHDGLLATLEQCFYQRQLIELSPKENNILELNKTFTVDRINLNDNSCFIEVTNIKIIEVLNG